MNNFEDKTRCLVLEEFFEEWQVSPIKALDQFVSALFDLRTENQLDDWQKFCANFHHSYEPIWRFLQRDPYTHHSICKPRGYAGDATLIDYIYSQNPAQDISELGHIIFSYITNSLAGNAVRNRRNCFTTNRCSYFIYGLWSFTRVSDESCDESVHYSRRDQFV